MKNVVLCCDGTANEFAQDQTNVVKLFYALEQDSAHQVAYYHPGVGTMEPPGALTGFMRRWTKLLGKAIGYGLESDIRDAYVFLMNHYDPGDRLYLFGFSRGAFTARAVAGMLHMYGLIRAGNEPLVPYAIRMLTAINAVHSKGRLAKRADVQAIFALAGQFRATFTSTDCKPHFCGVWDTVSSVGWLSHPLTVPYSAHNPDIHIGRHAVSIDERRAFFRQNLWSAPPSDAPQDIKQVWFPGVHCDVGGGYLEAESGLSKIALAWMFREAEEAGLLVNQQRRDEVLGKGGGQYTPPDSAAKMHESLEGFWRLAEFVPKRHYDAATKRRTWRMNLFRHRYISEGSLIHISALQRSGGYEKRLPKNIITVQ